MRNYILSIIMGIKVFQEVSGAWTVQELYTELLHAGYNCQQVCYTESAIPDDRFSDRVLVIGGDNDFTVQYNGEVYVGLVGDKILCIEQ